MRRKPPLWKQWINSHTRDELINLFQKNYLKQDIMKIIGYNILGGYSAPFKKLYNYCINELKINLDGWIEKSKIEARKIQNKKISLFWRSNEKDEEKWNRLINVLTFKSEKRLSGTWLKQLLFDYNLLENKCYECGQLPYHNNKPLMLQLEHIDGNNCNNTFIFDIEKQRKLNPDIGKTNLTILCPNCHTQTDTYAGKNAKNN